MYTDQHTSGYGKQMQNPRWYVRRTIVIHLNIHFDKCNLKFVQNFVFENVFENLATRFTIANPEKRVDVRVTAFSFDLFRFKS
jgi:hypothetical protein